jgi:hypothetical protein
MTTPVIDINKRVGQYVSLRDLIAAKDKAHKEAMEPYRTALEDLNGVLLGHLDTVGVDNAKTESGTVYKTAKDSVTIADMTAFWDYVTENQEFDLIDKKANVTAVKEFLDKNQSLPPGLNLTSRNVVGVRRK